MLKENADRAGEEFWDGADLVIEVVSNDAKSRQRDLVDKRQEYAEAGIPEYWIVDPQKEHITVLTLTDTDYAIAGQYSGNQAATSVLLPGFSVEAAKVFAAGAGKH